MAVDSSGLCFWRCVLIARVGLLVSALADISPSRAADDWALDPASSVLTYQSVKKNTIVETNQIRNLAGTLSSDGKAEVTIDLNSVDTGIDLRNVRMRFLFFETFKYPTATVTAKLNPADFNALPKTRRMTTKFPFTLDLHGVDKQYEADVFVTMISDSSVSVTSKAPVLVKVEDFGLLPNVEKLQMAANVTNIVPIASVSFDFVFNKAGIAPVTSAPVAAVEAQPAKESEPVAAAAAVGPIVTDAAKTSYSDEECLNRFEVLSRTGAIYFRSGSARLDPASEPVLSAVLDAAQKCPGLKIEIAGHTDADGSAGDNRSLSLKRARAVARYMENAGIPAQRISAAGYGEDRPIVSNDTDKNKALNRRIEFSATSNGQ